MILEVLQKYEVNNDFFDFKDFVYYQVNFHRMPLLSNLAFIVKN